VIVGNISAGSWGPPNMLAYARKFGLFDADVVVVVLSSHDYADAPTFTPIVGVDPSFPEHRPWCATWEALTRYLPRHLRAGSPPSNEGDVVPKVSPAKISQCLESLDELLKMGPGARYLALHWEKGELGKAQPEGHRLLAQVASERGVRLIDLGAAFAQGVAQGSDLYRDGIHPSAAGQKILADAILAELRRQPATRP
jgi:hypothetical protein